MEETMNNTIDVFCPCSPKDSLKLSYVVKSLVENFKELKDIHICVPDKTNFKDYEVGGHKVIYHEDFEVLPVRPLVEQLRFRPNWIFQQWLKLLQPVTTNVNLTWDADCILTKPLSAYENGKLKLFVQPNDNDESAFLRFSAKATGGVLGRWETNDRCHTDYIADFALFNREWIGEMLGKFFPTAIDFLQFSTLNTYWKNNDTKHAIFLSEYQLFGEYIDKFHNEEVEKVQLKKRQIDRNQFSQIGNLWTMEEIEREIQLTKEQGFDTLKLQSNSPLSDVGWKDDKK